MVNSGYARARLQLSSALSERRQMDCKFEASLSYKVRLCLLIAPPTPCSKERIINSRINGSDVK